MKKRRIWVLGLAALLVMPAVAWAQAKGHIKLTTVVEVEKEVFNAEGRKVLQRISVADAAVIPGSEVIYTMRYENISDKAAENAVITDPIPANTLYQAGSAAGEGTDITFSVDNGKSFHIPAELFVFDASGRKFPARTQDYTHIRWAFTKPLPPGGKGEVSFRAIIQ